MGFLNYTGDNTFHTSLFILKKGGGLTGSGCILTSDFNININNLSNVQFQLQWSLIYPDAVVPSQNCPDR